MPLSVLLMSSMAEVSGLLLSLLIPTCAQPDVARIRSINVMNAEVLVIECFMIDGLF